MIKNKLNECGLLDDEMVLFINVEFVFNVKYGESFVLF